MADPLAIPTLYDGTAYYRTTVTLDGLDVVLDFAWSELFAVWNLRVYAPDGAILAGPIRCYPDRPMLRYYHSDPRVPPGELVVERIDKDFRDTPGLYDLGRACRLVYYPAA